MGAALSASCKKVYPGAIAS